jgi:alpha-D-xyloside xylohydrolase
MGNSFVFNKDKYSLRITNYSDKVIRVTYSTIDDYEKNSFIVTAKPKDNINSEVVFDVDDDLNIKFYHNDIQLSSISCPALEPYDIYSSTGGKVEIRNTVDGVKSHVVDEEKHFVRTSNHANFNIKINDSETLFGLGSHEEGFPCLNGEFVPLYQENMRIAIPYFVSNKGYAYLFDCTSYITFDNRDKENARMYLDSVDYVDYYFIFGNDFDDICASYRFLTGITPMLPKWCCGYIQSKEYYKNQKELIDIATEYRKRKVPLDCIVQDWQYWRDGLWGDKNFDPARYPDMKACIYTLHNMNVHIIISAWSNFFGESSNRLEFVKNDMLLSDGSVYNAFDENAKKIYWKQADEGLFHYGIDGLWCDSTEPYDANWDGADREPLDFRMKKSIEEFKKYLDDSIINAYSISHSKGIYENQRKAYPNKRVVNITRSATSGQHRYSTIVWSGDISATWQTLAKQVNIMQNYIACGEAYWNCDIGGFFSKNREDKWFWSGDYPDGCQDDGYRELYTRWFQFAVFTPLLRSHGTDTPREIWRFGEKGSAYYDAIKSSIELRYRLIPYFYSINAAVTFDGKMPVKPLALAYQNDKAACRTFDEYMYGNEILVCPITEQGIKKKKIYLPKGIWYDFYTDEKLIGGCYIIVDCTIDKIPLFVKAGSIIPTAKLMQHTNEIPNVPYDIKVYSGADGEFILYDDDGNTYEYENGAYSRIRISYADCAKKITTEQLGKDSFAHNLNFKIF